MLSLKTGNNIGFDFIIVFSTECVYGGEYYTRGDIFDKGDNCNKCTCMDDGTVQCSEKYCFPGNPRKQKLTQIDKCLHPDHVVNLTVKGKVVMHELHW